MDDLAGVIKNNTGLVSLYLNGNNLQSSATVVLQALKGNSHLCLNQNNMSGKVVSDLASVIIFKRKF